MDLVPLDQIPTKEQISNAPDDPVLLYKTCLEMTQICEKNRGIGLSAVQVGIPWKLFIIKSDGTCPLIPNGKYGFFVNCDYTPVGDRKVMSLEGCLSIKKPSGEFRRFLVERYERILLTGKMFDNSNIVDITTEITAHQQGIVFQHEADHANSVTIADIGKEMLIW